MALDYELRQATEADYAFIWHVGSTTMRDYVAAIRGWDEAWQEARFRGNFIAERWRIIVVGGEDAGTLQVERRPAELSLHNINLLPAWQSRGIGSAIVGRLMAEAHAMGVPLTLTVLKTNPDAKRLYERLGMVVVGETEVKYTLAKSPESHGTS